MSLDPCRGALVWHLWLFAAYDLVRRRSLSGASWTAPSVAPASFLTLASPLVADAMDREGIRRTERRLAAKTAVYRGLRRVSDPLMSPGRSARRRRAVPFCALDPAVVDEPEPRACKVIDESPDIDLPRVSLQQAVVTIGTINNTLRIHGLLECMVASDVKADDSHRTERCPPIWRVRAQVISDEPCLAGGRNVQKMRRSETAKGQMVPIRDPKKSSLGRTSPRGVNIPDCTHA